MQDLDVSLTHNSSHDDAISKVIEILQSANASRGLAVDIANPHSLVPYTEPDRMSRLMDAYNSRGLSQRSQIAGAGAEYRAAVTSLVIEGSLNIDDGRDLLAIVEGILREHGMT
jgi:hypothetical protein